MDFDEPENVAILKEMHVGLGRKYKQHQATIDKLWRSFDEGQRTRCVKGRGAGPARVVLRDPLDASMGNAWKMIPDWNLRDLAGPTAAPDYFLDLLKHRATVSLFAQFHGGVGGRPGDWEHIAKMVRTKGLGDMNPPKNVLTLFLDDECYGRIFVLRTNVEENFEALSSRHCIPKPTAEFVLERQAGLIKYLVAVIDDILDEGSQTRDDEVLPTRSDDAAVAAFSRLTIEPQPASLTPSDLAASAHEQKATLDERLDMLCAEPVVLAHAVNLAFYTRPEMVPDEQGRRYLQATTDRNISGVVVDVVHGAVKGAAIWSYICRLLELLDGCSDQAYRKMLVQELSNVCHFEYDRARANFKRNVQGGTGSKWFKRQPGALDKAGNARVLMQGDPRHLIASDAQLHHVLRLCQAETGPSEAVEWLKKLAEFHNAYPLERTRLKEREADALWNLAVVVRLIQGMSSISLPAPSRRNARLFISRSQDIDMELNRLKSRLDLLDFALPINNLLKPGMAEGALNKLDQFIIDETGTSMGFLYEDLINDCLEDLDRQYQQAKAATEQKATEEGTDTD